MLETFASYLDSIAQMAPIWKFLLVFVFMAVESSFIPFPSEVVMIPAAFFAARGEMGTGPVAMTAIVLLVGILGSLAGAYVNYYLALALGKPFLEKYGKWFFLKPAALARACELFNQYGAATTFVCRMIPAIRQLISIPAGIAKMPLGSFTLFTALGAGVWTAILVIVGYLLGKSASDMTYLELCQKGKEMSQSHLPLVILSACVLVAIYYGVSKWVMKSRDK